MIEVTGSVAMCDGGKGRRDRAEPNRAGREINVVGVFRRD